MGSAHHSGDGGRPVRTLAAGLGLTEGPLWTRDGRLLVVSISRGTVFEIDLGGGGARALADVGGAPSGLAEDADGAIWIAQGGSHLRRDPDREVPPAVQRLDGAHAQLVATAQLAAPNDLVVGPAGLLWFTDPHGAALHGTPEPGRIWTLDRRDGALRLAAEGALYPNGLAFAPDPAVLYVAETATRRLLRYPCADGVLGASEVLAELSDGHPDGLAVDAAGNLVVAATTAGAVIVLDPDGVELERIETGTGSVPTNVCYGGPELATLFVTVAKGGRVLAVPRKVPGLPLPPFRAATDDAVVTA
jgi:gluconolactonase